MYKGIRTSKYFHVNCMRLDIYDYMHGEFNKEKVLEYLKSDFDRLIKAIEEDK